MASLTLVAPEDATISAHMSTIYDLNATSAFDGRPLLKERRGERKKGVKTDVSRG
jgi:hypothetical protein